jgi:hypothetical protein
MNVLVCLPETQTIVILTEWISFSDLVFLDTATCSRQARRLLHEQISSPHAVFTAFEKNQERRDCSVAFINWVVRRGIHLVSLKAPGKLDVMPGLRRDFLKASGICLRRVNVTGALSNVLFDVAQFCTRIEALCVSDCRYGDAEETTVLGCLAVEQALLCAVQSSRETLRTLQFSSCKAFGEGIIVSAATLCIQLYHLDLHNTALTDAGLRTIVQTCQALRHLDIGCCDELSDTGIIALAQHCPQLEHLYVAELSLTDAALTALASSCHHLRVLTIGRNNSITDVSVLAIAVGCPLLESLCIPLCGNITDESITALARGCPHLHQLYLGSMPSVTDAALTALATHCSELTDLWVSCCSRITDAGVLQVVERCAQLQCITLNGCWRVTKAALDAFHSDVRVVYFDAHTVSSDAEDEDVASALEVLDIAEYVHDHFD